MYTFDYRGSGKLQDRVAQLQSELTTLQNTALQSGSPVNARQQRITQLKDPVLPSDAVNLRFLQRYLVTSGVPRPPQPVIPPVQVPVGGPPPPPPPGSGLGVSGRGFTKNGARHLWDGISAFPLLWYYLEGLDASAEVMLDFCAANRVTTPRILLSMWSTGYWAIPGNMGIKPINYGLTYYSKLDRLLDACLARNLTPQLVIFGDCHDVYSTPIERQFFVDQVANYIKTRNAPVFMQIANEADQINVGNQESIDLVSVYLAADPNRVVNSGGPHGGSPGGGGSLAFNVPPNKYITFHSDRLNGYNGWEWVYQLPTYPPVAQTDRPPVDDEPINAGPLGSPGHFDDDPSHWLGYGVVSRFMKLSTTFHYDGGFRDGMPPPGDSTTTCFNAWRQGLDFVEFDDPGNLWGYTSGGPYADSAVNSLGGSLLIMGRHNGTSGKGVVLDAPGGWVPSPATGWTVTVVGTLGSCRLLTVQRS